MTYKPKTDMGYYTDYELTHNADIKEAIGISDYINGDGDLEYAIGDESQPSKWYKWKQDMIEMSKHFPQVTFTLEGHGEEWDDLWRATILNGSVQKKKATITF